jgi:type II pantothenate kinase
MHHARGHFVRGAGRSVSVIVVADLGGSNTDLLLADAGGVVLRSGLCPAVTPAATAAWLDQVLAPLAVGRAGVERLIVTGGRHRLLPDAIEGLPLTHVDEIAAIARGGLASAGCARALVVSMGTGTAFVVAEGDRAGHRGGVALGGGTVRGLAARLLGATDPERIAALSEAGRPRGADLTVADLVGSGVGILPGDMPAAYLARLADSSAGAVTPEDIAAGLLDMVGHVVGHLALLTARLAGHDTIVVVGHMPEFVVVRRALLRFEGALGGPVIVPDEPGLAVARGALAIALRGG